MLEVHPERVDPEAVEVLGIAHGDVAGDALVEAELAEQAERRREPLLAVQPLLLDGVELREGRPGREAVQSCGNLMPGPARPAHSVRSASAGRIRAAERAGHGREQVGERRPRPGPRAARRRGRAAARTTTGKLSASQRHTSRPATMPSGTPTISAGQPRCSVACHAIATRVWRRVKPIERSTASSWRRRRTVVTSACATVAVASSAKKTPSASGSESSWPRLTTAVGNVARADSKVQLICCPAARRCSAAVDVGSLRPLHEHVVLEDVRVELADAARRPARARRPSSTRSGRSRCATTRERARCRRPSPCAAVRVPDGDAVADVQLQIVQRAGTERDLVGATSARARSSTTGDMSPFSVSIAQVGVATPLMRTLRTHDRVHHPRDVAVVRDRRDGLRGHRPLARRRPRSSTTMPDRCGIWRRVGEAGAEREAADDTEHADDRADERRPDRHRAPAAARLDREAGPDRERGREPGLRRSTRPTVDGDAVATAAPVDRPERRRRSRSRARQRATAATASPSTTQSAWNPTSRS